MASATELSLESIRNFMIYRGGRVTNHELVHHFKEFLTNSETKEIARDQFKQYVNALSLVVKEDNNKYLVLKKKYRGDAPLDSILRSPEAHTPDHKYNPSPSYAPQNTSGPSDYGASPKAAAAVGRGRTPHQRSMEVDPEVTHHKKNDANPFLNYKSSSPYSPHQYQRSDSNSSYSGSSPPPLPPRQVGNSPFNGAPSTTRHRTPPPYRPPPPPPESPIMDNFSPPYGSHDYNRFPAPPPPGGHLGNQVMNQHHLSKDSYRSPEQYQDYHRRPSYEAHAEDDVHNLHRSTSFNEPPDLGIPVAQNFQPSSKHSHSLHNLAPSQSKHSGRKVPPPPTDGMLQSRPIKSKSGSPSSDVSQPSSDDSTERRTMERARLHKHRGNDHNKENFGPHNAKYPRQGSMSSTSEDSESVVAPASGESEKKISVKEKTQIFNRMASETDLGEKVHKNGTKSNRSSRAEKEYDDSISISSYGQDGQDWLVASASSDFNEILRLLKAHPELIRRKRHTYTQYTLIIPSIIYSSTSCKLTSSVRL
ncbi:hypothetical protein FHG87_000885 [Trinorchestia longiramus]|nr:hypothetical protein FHG87_000885 [Trinorchestia longiramus]